MVGSLHSHSLVPIPLSPFPCPPPHPVRQGRRMDRGMGTGESKGARACAKLPQSFSELFLSEVGPFHIRLEDNDLRREIGRPGRRARAFFARVRS